MQCSVVLRPVGSMSDKPELRFDSSTHWLRNFWYSHVQLGVIAATSKGFYKN